MMKLTLVLLILALLMRTCTCASIISGQITTCERSSEIVAEQSCAEKLSVSLTLSAGEKSKFEYEISSATKNALDISLSTPIRVTISLEDNVVIYPLTYVKTFNAKPVEKVIVSNSFLVSKCDDSPSSKAPTCGWQYNSNQEKIENSQGFCCECEFGDALGISPSDANTRGGISCNKLLTKQASAHCVILDEINYLGFNLESPTITYNIKVEVQIGETLKVLNITPSLKTQSMSGLGASLVGNFAPFQQVSSFNNMMLFVADGDNEIARAGADYMMLIDKTYVTLTGTECDKIGTLYSAFRTQSNGCKQKPMTCLQNQLLDFHNSDLERIRSGKVPQYHIVRYGDYYLTMRKTAALVLTPREMTVAMINLVIDTKSITTILERGTGKIDSANLGQIDMNNQASLVVRVTNTGLLSATFLVSVDCTSEVVGVLTQKTIYINKGGTSPVSWVVYSGSSQKSTGSCLISLYDVIGSVLDQQEISFQNNALNPVSGDAPVDSSGMISEKQDSNLFSQLFSISEECKNCKFYNVVCFVVSKCYAYLMILVASVIAAMVVLVILALFFYCGGGRLLVKVVKRNHCL